MMPQEEEPMPKDRRRGARRLRFTPLRRADWLLLLLAPLVGWLLLESFARASLWDALISAVSAPLPFFLSYGWLTGVFALLHLLRNDKLRLCLLLFLCLLLSLLGIAAHYKMLYRFEPLLLSDAAQLGDAAQVITGLNFDISPIPIIAAVAAFVVGIVATCIWVRARRDTHGILIPVVGLMLAVAVPFACTFSLAGAMDRTDLVAHAKAEGSLYTVFAVENHRRSLLRVDATPEKVETAYRALAEDTPVLQDAEQPNLIFVLAESFIDGGRLAPYLQLKRPLTPFYDELAESCASGTLTVPKVGGGTSETEFEVLTGLESKYAQNPYSMGLPPLNSVAAVLRSRGYTSTALHWHTGVFYNRYENLRKLGFDRFFTTDVTTHAFDLIGSYVTDAEHYRSVLETLRKTEQRDFVFALTMQNHGGYTYWDFETDYEADTPFSNRLSPQSELVLRNYCYLLKQSDDALREWIAELKTFEEPTVVVFFGDHIPPLGAEVFEEIGMKPAGEEGRQTPYFIWSNRGNQPVRADLKAPQLAAYALELAGLGDDPFFHGIEMSRQAGGLVGDWYDLLSYDALFGKQYAYADAGIIPQSESYQIGGSMAVTGFEALDLGGEVMLAAQTSVPGQRYAVHYNGQPLETTAIPKSEKPFALQLVMTDTRGAVLNRSDEMTFSSTEELLQKAKQMQAWEVALEEMDFVLFRDEWWNPYRVYRTEQSFDASRYCVAADGKRLAFGNPDQITGAGQAGLYAPTGCLYVSIPKSEMKGDPFDGESARAWMREHQARLLLPDVK